MSEQPFGEGPYFCKNHPERECVPPMAYRRCQECKEDMQARYASEWRAALNTDPLGLRSEYASDGRAIGHEYAQRKERDRE